MFLSHSKIASVKDGILNQIGEQIKALQIGQQNADQEGDTNYKVTSRNIHLQCLLDLLDHVLLHGLVNIENGYWPFVVMFTHSETVNLVSKHPQVSNGLDKGRVWVFVAVCEGLLESYIRLFIQGQKNAKKLYTRDAFVRDKERLVLLQTLVSGLDYVPIVLDMTSPYLGYGGLPAPLIKGDSSSPLSVIKNGSERVHSRRNSRSTSSSLSSSSTIQAETSPCLPSSDIETFDLTDQSETPKNSREVEANVLFNHKESELARKLELNQPNDLYQGIDSTEKYMESKYCNSTSKPPLQDDRVPVNAGHSVDTESVHTDQLVDTEHFYTKSDDSKILRHMDPHFEEDFSSDFRARLDSNLSEISMEDVDLVVRNEYIRTRRIMRRKRRPKTSEVESKHSSTESEKDTPSEDQAEDAGVTKLYTRTSSYLSDGLNDSGSPTSSVVSGDSLDQFCRNADFGSLNNLSCEIPVQSVVTECQNEGTIMAKEVEVDEEKIENAQDKECKIEGVMSSDYEGIILGLPKRPSLQDIPGNSCDVKIDANTILLLSLDIFKNSHEQFHRMMRSFTGHHYGQLQCAYIVLTDFAVYLVRKVAFREESSFHTEVGIEFSNIKAIEIGLNCQLVTVASKKEQFTITFADEAVLRSFISSLTSQVSRCCPSMSLSNLVSSTALQQESTIVKWMSKDKHLNMTTQNTSCFSLVRWCGLTGPDSQIEVVSFQSTMEGTLEFKQYNYLRMSSRWTTGYFVLLNGTLWHYSNKNDKAAKNMIDLSGVRCGGCRQLHDDDHPYAFEIVSSDGTGSLLVLAAQNEHEACEWIFKICQSIAQSYDDDSDRGCTVMQWVPCCLTTTKEKIVICLAQPGNGSNYKYVTSCPIESITKIFVDNSFRNYCIIKFEHSEVLNTEGSWFVSFNTEYELGKFETAVAEAWRELFQVDLQFLVLGNNTTRREARERAKIISTFYTEGFRNIPLFRESALSSPTSSRM